MGDMISLIKDIGFPIFVAMYLLARIEGKIDKLVAAFVDLTEAFTDLTKQVNRVNQITGGESNGSSKHTKR